MNLSHPTLPAFGKRLKRLRRALGIKQAALADLIQVDQATISRWENTTNIPDKHMQEGVFKTLSPYRADDPALKRLVERSVDCVHLVEEASHICIAYSKGRSLEWSVNQSDLIGVSLWQFATNEIRQAENELLSTDWWDAHTPKPKTFQTSKAKHEKITIRAGPIVWERLYLSDGTPVRLVSGARLVA